MRLRDLIDTFGEMALGCGAALIVGMLFAIGAVILMLMHSCHP